MSGNVKVRPCRLEEASDVLAFWAHAANASATDTLQGLSTLFEEREDSLLLALDGERIVGTVVWGFDGWRGNIYRLAVDPAYRRQGIARRLLAEAERRLALRGAKRLAAVIDTHSKESAPFWQSLAPDGWQPTHNGMRFAKLI